MTNPEEKSLSARIKQQAFLLGFDLCGIAPVQIMKENGDVLRNWCLSGMNGDIDYLVKNQEKRIDPGLLLPGASSVIVTGISYAADKIQGGDGIPTLSRYAYGSDYHYVIKPRLHKLLGFIKAEYPGAEGRTYVDSAPVFEKAWAQKAGLGWQGRHSILINKKAGSFFFLGVILIDKELCYDSPAEDHCGTCTLCVESCPTGAINDNRTIDVRKCIAYHTIESKSAVPEELAPKFGGRVFGCDICQEACPWNKDVAPHKNAEFELPPEVKQMSREEWLSLSEEKFNTLFKKSAILRSTYAGFMKNLEIVTKAGK